LFFDYRRQHQLPIKVPRIFNTYGPRMSLNDGRVVPNFIVQALRGEPITIFGDGEQTRSFCYVADLIEGLVGLMKTPPSFTGPVNLGRPDEFSMLELAKTVIDLTGSRSRLMYQPLPQDDPRVRKPDTSLAKAAIGWQPETSLRDGLRLTIAYIETQLRKERSPMNIHRTMP
jgi:UDP-glucuronate decarboxylase